MPAAAMMSSVVPAAIMMIVVVMFMLKMLAAIKLARSRAKSGSERIKKPAEKRARTTIVSARTIASPPAKNGGEQCKDQAQNEQAPETTKEKQKKRCRVHKFLLLPKTDNFCMVFT
jgi:hypothetical protein